MWHHLPPRTMTVIRTLGRRAVYAWRWQRSPRRQLLKLLPRHAVCVEIGVWTGEFSERIIQYTKPRVLHLIDPWLFDPPTLPMRGRFVAKSSDDMDTVYESVLEKFRNRAIVHRGTSESVLPTFPDNYFDWVYIDGNHAEDFVRSDLELALTKVKDGGIIAGDDYSWDRCGDGYPVQRAVLGFVRDTGLTLTVVGNSQFILGPDSRSRRATR